MLCKMVNLSMTFAKNEAIRYESLLELNQLNKGMEVATGEKIYLHVMAPSRPLLVSQKSNQQSFSNQNNSVAAVPVTHIYRPVKKKPCIAFAKKYGVDVGKRSKNGTTSVHLQLKKGKI